MKLHPTTINNTNPGHKNTKSALKTIAASTGISVGGALVKEKIKLSKSARTIKFSELIKSSLKNNGKKIAIIAVGLSAAGLLTQKIASSLKEKMSWQTFFYDKEGNPIDNDKIKVEKGKYIQQKEFDGEIQKIRKNAESDINQSITYTVEDGTEKFKEAIC